MFEAVKQIVRQNKSIPSRSTIPQPPQATSHRRRRDRSTVPIQTEVDATIDHQTSVKPLRQGKKAFEDPIVNTDVDVSEEYDKSSSPLVNSSTPKMKQKSSSQQPLSTNLEQLQNTLITTAEHDVRQSLFNNIGTLGSTTLNFDTIDRLQDTLVQTIEKRANPTKENSNELNNLFDDLKRTLVNAIIEQQPMLLQDLIKQSVADALKNQHKSMLNVTTTTNGQANRQKAITLANSREIKISADTKKTCIDTNFRQQRDAVVANKRFRDLVQQWSAISSMKDLTDTIKRHGTNKLEYAWLLFCWIGHYIKYALNCNINAAESVFRTRQGVCRGFASLYHECCSLLGVDCYEISGYAKNNLVKTNEELNKSPHAWNSIVLDNYTYLVDPTWGAGGRDNENKLEDFYFLTSPEEFIYTHYCSGYQLLAPEISRAEFLSLPIMRSIYYQLGLNLLSPKQGFNEISENLFKISIRTPKHVNMFATLNVGKDEYPRNLHTFCQRDETNRDIFNCYIAPPVDGLYNIDIFANTNNEQTYQGAINMRLRVSNITNAFTFPMTYLTFKEHNCILIEPLQGVVHKNEEILIHMIIPNANVIEIQNGHDHIVPTKDEYKKGLLKKKIRVQDDIKVCGRWDDNADTISTICIFYMI
ncbi:unnamed protein product [Adineta steineri]|uniref:Transglutaminase-like domain-containing protein n=1 Tax=Adineta steineri TaxID=433720 RepID=A0A819GEV8_9BILA|nr:unnamed protein product [Adineta steineri]